jgi:hypothetical protein
MFEEAIRYPWKGEDNLKNVANGGVLTLLGVFLLPMFFVLGYGLEVIRRVSDGDVAEPPAWEDWGTLFVDGLKVFVITVVYSLIPAAIFAFAVFSWFVPVVVSNGSEPSGGLAALGFLVGLLVFLLSMVVALAFAYVVPAAIAAFARTDRLGSAFSPSQLRSIGGHRGFAVAWVVAFAVTLVASAISGALSATGIGAILGAFVVYYGTIAAAYAIGEGISEIPVVAEREEVAIDESAA